MLASIFLGLRTHDWVLELALICSKNNFVSAFSSKIALEAAAARSGLSSGTASASDTGTGFLSRFEVRGLNTNNNERQTGWESKTEEDDYIVVVLGTELDLKWYSPKWHKRKCFVVKWTARDCAKRKSKRNGQEVR